MNLMSSKQINTKYIIIIHRGLSLNIIKAKTIAFIFEDCIYKIVKHRFSSSSEKKSYSKAGKILWKSFILPCVLVFPSPLNLINVN